MPLSPASWWYSVSFCSLSSLTRFSQWQMELAEADYLRSAEGANEQDAHLDEVPFRTAAERRLLQPISFLITHEKATLEVWEGGHRFTPILSYPDGIHVSDDFLLSKVSEVAKEFKLPLPVRKTVHFQKGQILMFYSSLPHAGSANTTAQENMRLFGTFFPKDPEDDEAWLVVKSENTTAPLPRWFAENLCPGSRQAQRWSLADG
jgi:ectoine hydroxylase-related dioxygenase (phytanoyl-CoA dioxygenase family)